MDQPEPVILVIDDSAVAREIILDALRQAGLAATLRTAANGREALDLMKTEDVDLVLCDLEMPGIDGLGFLDRVNASDAWREIPVIILTGHGTDQDEAEARALGGFDFLRKPAEIDLLVRKIKEAFAEKIERIMSAIAFAEGGDLEDAKKILKKEE